MGVTCWPEDSLWIHVLIISRKGIIPRDLPTEHCPGRRTGDSSIARLWKCQRPQARNGVKRRPHSSGLHHQQAKATLISIQVFEFAQRNLANWLAIMDGENVPLLERIAVATNLDLVEQIHATRPPMPRYAERYFAISGYTEFRGRFRLDAKHILFWRGGDYPNAIFRRRD